MELMLIFLCSFSVFNVHAFHLEKEIKNNTNNSVQLSSITVTEGNVDVSKNRLHLVELNSRSGCLFNCILIKWSYCDYATSTCLCFSNAVLIGNECLNYASLGGICKYSMQCKTLNAVCLFGRCVCNDGYENYAGSCYKSSNRKIGDKNLDDVVIVMIAISIGIVIVVTICCTVALCKKKADRTQPRIQNGGVSIVHPPPEFSPYQTQYAGYNTPINSVEPNFHNMDKPPSYEDVMNALGSRSNLINHDVPPSASNFTYGAAMQNARPFPS